MPFQQKGCDFKSTPFTLANFGDRQFLSEFTPDKTKPQTGCCTLSAVYVMTPYARVLRSPCAYRCTHASRGRC